MAVARALRLVPAASILFFFIFFVSSGMARDVLKSGETLLTNQYLDSGPYTVIMQKDCNLVFYVGELVSKNAIWHTNTADGSRTCCRCTLASNGNLCVFDRNDNQLWCSNKSGPDGHYVLVLQDDRNLVIYGGAIWATGTNNIGKGINFIKEGNRLPA